MINDFRKGDLLPEELRELSTLSSMVDIIPQNRLRSAFDPQVSEN